MKARGRAAVYARYVRTERWLTPAASAWLAAIALLIAGWLVSASLLRTGLHVLLSLP